MGKAQDDEARPVAAKEEAELSTTEQPAASEQHQGELSAQERPEGPPQEK